MFGLPKTTDFNKKIPKQKFYEKLEITPALKRVFVELIKAVYWTNKIAASTTNLAVGKYVSEIEIFKVELSSDNLDLSALQLIDKAIPYHNVFILSYDGKCQALASYKTNSEVKQKDPFRQATPATSPAICGGSSSRCSPKALAVGGAVERSETEGAALQSNAVTEGGFKKNKILSTKSFFRTPWLPESELTLPINGLDLDTVYENIVRFIAGDALISKEDKEESLQECIQRAELRQKLTKQIERLQSKIIKEKSFARQVELNTQLKALKRQLEELMN